MNVVTFDALFLKEHKVLAQLKEIQTAIKALQALCAHEWRYKGHSHNDEHYQCTICRKEEDR